MDLHERWSDLAFAVLMATATVLTAWCAYQASRWGGIQAISAGEANALRSESLRQSNHGAQLMAIDVGLWVQYVSALNEKNERMADFLAARFPPTLKLANNAWLDTRPLSNEDAPPSPFAMPEYSLPSFEEAQLLADIAMQKIEESKDANENSNNYVLLTV